MKIQKQQEQRWEMLKLQQSEVRDLEILAKEEMNIRRRGKPSGVGSQRAGPSGVGRMRAGILEARSLGGSPAAMSPVAVPCSNSCSVPKYNNDLIICPFFQISMFLMLLL